MSQSGAVETTWRRSGRCESQHCVEVALLTGAMAVRNSTDPTRRLVFSGSAWQAFLKGLRP